MQNVELHSNKSIAIMNKIGQEKDQLYCIPDKQREAYCIVFRKSLIPHPLIDGKSPYKQH